MTYVALDPDYIQGLIEMGYEETRALLKNREVVEFEHLDSYSETIQKIRG